MQLTYEQLRATPAGGAGERLPLRDRLDGRKVHWAGVRFHDLLALAGPLPAATAIRFVSAEEPYVDSLTLDQALLPT